ncbi:hypothetical protein [Microvirga alba]|uniref:Uncharacterized protein n=1 Tax=Microvirga alba TaxID=2791025 RepID=A0A931FR12_9HYPH|nr:hypothetical protein [Microvirga alba]MBF9234038.1 hypothetical protein [Microvirga alba]
MDGIPPYQYSARPSGSALKRRWCAAIALIFALALLFAVYPRPPDCTPADVLRVSIGGVGYRVSALLQPEINGLARAAPAQDGIRFLRRYCQKPDEPAFAVNALTLHHGGLAETAALKAELAPLAGIRSVVLRAADLATLDAGQGSPVANGTYRRIDRSGPYDLVSTRPMLFGSPIIALCDQRAVPVDQGNPACMIWGRIGAGSALRIQVGDVPVEAWPEMLKSVERLIVSLRE